MKNFLLNSYSGIGNIHVIPGLVLFFVLSINLQGQKYQMILTEDWKNGAWQNSNKTAYTYDGNEFLISTLSQSWDETLPGWVNSTKSLHSNNPDGTVNNTIAQIWDDQDNVWKDMQRITYTYNTAKKVLTAVTEMWTGSDWLNFAKQTNTYDVNNYLTKELSQTWDFVSNWNNVRQSNYTNNPDGTPNQVIDQVWIVIPGNWTDSERSTFTYNASGGVLTELHEVWSTGTWVNNALYTNTWDLNNRITKELSQAWVTGINNWDNEAQSDYAYNTDGTLYQIVSQSWQTDTDTWLNAQRITFTYVPTTGRQEIRERASFILYPNPAGDFVTIRSDYDVHSAKYSLEDQSGKQVITGKLGGTITTLDISRLPAGIYFLRVGERGQNIYKILKK